MSPPAFGALEALMEANALAYKDDHDWPHTSDLDDDFFIKLGEMCVRLECDPADMLGCWMSESGVHSSAYNKGGDAAGIFQVIGSTRKMIGFTGSADEFLALSATNQLEWAERFYLPYAGLLLSPGACYLATFLPALVRHAFDPQYVVCGAQGPFVFAYAGNWMAFDPTKKGYITVQDLTDRIHRVTTGPRWEELIQRICRK